MGSGGGDLAEGVLIEADKLSPLESQLTLRQLDPPLQLRGLIDQRILHSLTRGVSCRRYAGRRCPYRHEKLLTGHPADELIKVRF